MGERLTIDLLEELAKRWRDQSAPIASELQPGLTRAEMDELVEPLGMTIPAEARVWWGWHNGGRRASIGVPVGFSHDSLHDGVRHAELHRRLAREVAAGDPQRMWRWNWLPWSYDVSGAALVIDADEDAPLSPVFVHLTDDTSDVPVSAPSMGSLITWWIELFDVGACVYDRAAGRWHVHDGCIPAHYDPRLR